jgi:hypothetical protein
MDNPALDLVVLKQVCKELQRELAFATPDVEAEYVEIARARIAAVESRDEQLELL